MENRSIPPPFSAIADGANRRRDEIIRIRRDFHRNPERGWMEVRTASLLAARLETLGWDVRVGADVIDPAARMGLPPAEALEEAFRRALDGGAEETMAARMKGGFTGVVGVLEGRGGGGGGGGPTVALRFDIDANAGEEARDERHRPAREGFASAEPGTMHNCGHDGHAAIGLGVASLLGEIRDAWTGRVKVIFQPAEEGARGALAMVEAGVLDDADYFIVPHVGVRVTRTGKIVCGAGGFQATTKLDAVFTGKNAHAGLEPEAGRNALAAAATAFLQLQAISRHSGGGTRVNVGTLEGGTARNIIPDRAVLKLETRGETSDLDAYMQDHAHEVLRASALMHGVEVEIEKVGRTISAQSDPELTGVISEVASDLPDFDEVVLEEDYGAGDDAAFMMERVQRRGGKSAYLVLGTELPGGHHTPRFDFNEEVLVSGVKLFAALVCRLSGDA